MRVPRLLLAVPLAGLACGGLRTAGPAGAPDLPHLEERAALLALVDRQVYEPVIVRAGLAGAPELRRETAVALGRMGDPAGLEALHALLVDDQAEVRREAAFALGEVAELAEVPELARARAAARLLEAVDDPDRETGRLAVEALGKLGVVVVQVGEALGRLPSEEAWARLLPSLYRFREEAAVSLAADALAADDAELRSWAAYTLTREPLPAGLPHVRALAGDPDPRIRAWAARALGRLGAESDLTLLGPLLADPEAGPAIQALGAARRMVADGRAPPPASWRPRLLELLDEPRPHVRAAALDAASAWLPDGEIGAALARIARDPGAGVWHRGAALIALATGGDPRAEGLAGEAAVAADPALRTRAAEAAGIVGGRGLLAGLAADPEPRVRQAALAARLALGDPGDSGVARDALADPDPGVRASILEWSAAHPVLSLEDLAAALERAQSEPVIEERLSAMDALVARAEAEPGERGAIVALLETLAAEGDHPSRRRAAAGLAALGRPRPPPGPAETGRTAAVYRSILLQTARARTVAIETVRGRFRARLECPRTPLTCVAFLQLAGQGFYDGLAFHRVVPDFVVQGGDPRGDGWGGPGYAVRDEIGRLRFGRGVLGMALAGPDTGGSQFFVTLSPQPHLDGGYTAFGEVTEGIEVLDRLEPGDTILSVREVEAPRR
ncbi:MAG TPA: peptidylprolyl isomerase [Thermoanaerobaculia bacterium]|nr:peptidylprolyl isomerase [Thermoanaerobaculia bacterium]